MSLTTELKKASVVLLPVPRVAYQKRFIATAAELAKAFPKLCVVSLDQDAASLSKELEAAGVPQSSVLIVGARGGSPRRARLPANCVECDGTIVDVTMALFRFVDQSTPKAILFGPFATLARKNTKMEALKFINYIADDSRKAGRKFVLMCTCTKEDAGKKQAKDVELFMDKVISE